MNTFYDIFYYNLNTIDTSSPNNRYIWTENVSDITYTIDGQSLSPGIYIVKVQGSNDQVEWVSKIIKIE